MIDFDAYRTFWHESRRDFRGVGAILPSSRSLARALARPLGQFAGGPCRVLEVGPGTGAVTAALVGCLGPAARLDLIEINESFVALLTNRLASDPRFRSVADRVRIHQGSVEDFAPGETFDLVVSSLPLNNFTSGEIERVFAALGRLAPRGAVSFYEYIGVRTVRGLFEGSAERARLRGVGATLRRILESGEVRREAIMLNTPPAWVHHVKLGRIVPTDTATGRE